METKVCGGKCKLEKPIGDFNWKNKEKGTLYYACKECWNEANKERYHRNKQYYVNKANKFKQSVKKTAYERIFKYLADKKCVDCGENDPVVLQFDHVRGEKINCVSAWDILGPLLNLKLLNAKFVVPIVIYEKQQSSSTGILYLKVSRHDRLKETG